MLCTNSYPLKVHDGLCKQEAHTMHGISYKRKRKLNVEKKNDVWVMGKKKRGGGGGNVGSCADRRVEGTNWAKTETEMETDENRETEKERTKESTPNADGGDG